jgi:two-component system nitrogen regulation response regulator NtrX
MISGHGTIADAVEATRAGAFDFLEKPLSRDRVLVAVKNAMEHATLQQENERLRELVGCGPKMIGASPAWLRAVEQASMAARSDARVLLIGESGTGKELLAAHIHQNSPFAGGPFVKVNCAAIPTELLETELFGHEKGSFTGATAARRGKFELADGGTIFLDEVGDLHGASQAKLLRVLQEGEFHRVGGEQIIRVTVRVVSATNRDLGSLVSQEKFPSGCRHCASGRTIFACWPNTFWTISARATTSNRRNWTMRFSPCWRPTVGRETRGNCAT